MSTTFTDLRNVVANVIDDNAGAAALWTQAAQETMESIADQVTTVVDFSTLVDESGMTYTSPTTPNIDTPPTLDDTPPTLPTEPIIAAISPYVAPSVPSVATVGAVSYDAPTAPIAPSVSAPTWEAPDQPVDTVSMGGIPDDIAADTLSVLPTIDSLILGTFTSTVPTETINSLTAAYSYVEPTYADKVESEVTGVIQSVLGGALVVSVGVWNALWDRAAGDAGRQQVAEEWAASNFAASLGMTGLPSETLLARLDKAQQDTQSRLSGVRLEQAIQEALQRREDLWNGVRDGVAWEGLWINAHQQLAGRALATAAKAHEALIAVFNANIERHNILVRRALASVEEGRLILSRALAPLEESKTKLEKARVEVAQDDQRVRRWLGTWQGYQIDKTTQIAYFGEKLKQFDSLIRAEAARVQSEVQAAGLDVSIYGTTGQVYSATVQGAASKVNAELGIEKLKVDAADSGARIYQSQVAGETGRVNADIAIEQNKVSVYTEQIRAFSAAWGGISAKAGALASIYNASVNGFSAKVNDASQEGDLAYKKSIAKIQAAEQQVNLAIGQLEKLATLQAGVAQAYLSASDVNLGATTSMDYNRSMSANFSGECADPVSCGSIA
jgi:hypothetical protein